MFPVEACKDQQVRILHRVGDQQCVLTLQLRPGDTAQAKVLQAFQKGLLPPCLYGPTLEYAVLAIRESLSDDPSLSSASEGSIAQASHWLACMGVSEEPWRLSLGLDAALDDSLLELEERWWPRPLLSRRVPEPADSQLLEPAGRAAADFWRAYDFLLRHRPAFFRTIGTLEESYLKGIRELQSGLRRALYQLQLRQSMEMERVRVQAEKASLAQALDQRRAGDNESEDDNTDAMRRSMHDLVAQHVGELDAVELHWRTEIQEVKLRQKASYCDLVVDFFEQEVGQLSEEPDAEANGVGDGSAWPPCAYSAACAPVALDACVDEAWLARPLGALPAQPLLHWVSVGVSGGSEPQADARGRGELRILAEVRTVFGPRSTFFVLRLLVGDISDILPATDHGVCDTRAPNIVVHDDGAGPQLPPELIGLGSYRSHHLVRGSGVLGEASSWPLLSFHAATSPEGSQAAAANADGVGVSSVAASGSTSGRTECIFRSPSLRFWRPPRLPPPVGLSPNAYSDQLRGLVIPTPENLKFEIAQSVLLRGFAARCDRVADLHFPPLAEQLRQVQSATAAAPLCSGDYFCTRHSNLGGMVQAAFHLVTGSSEAVAADEIPTSIHRALRRLVSDCHRCHVAHLTLPLLLVDVGVSEISLPYAVSQRRSENVLRALKGALTRLAEELAPSETPELKVVDLVLPAISAQSISAGMPSVADSALLFLRNSFQCV